MADWRFSSGFPTTNVFILVVTVAGLENWFYLLGIPLMLAIMSPKGNKRVDHCTVFFGPSSNVRCAWMTTNFRIMKVQCGKLADKSTSERRAGSTWWHSPKRPLIITTHMSRETATLNSQLHQFAVFFSPKRSVLKRQKNRNVENWNKQGQHLRKHGRQLRGESEKPGEWRWIRKSGKPTKNPVEFGRSKFLPTLKLTVRTCQVPASPKWKGVSSSKHPFSGCENLSFSEGFIQV